MLCLFDLPDDLGALNVTSSSCFVDLHQAYLNMKLTYNPLLGSRYHDAAI
jgi:hypothetical protein